jgi:hypothetical protein
MPITVATGSKAVIGPNPNLCVDSDFEKSSV